MLAFTCWMLLLARLLWDIQHTVLVTESKRYLLIAYVKQFYEKNVRKILNNQKY